MKIMIKAVLLIAAMGVLGGIAQAAPVCVPPSGPLAYCEEIFTQTVPPTSIPWNTNLNFPGFDDMGGTRTLLGIEITQTVNFVGALDFLNTLWSNGCPGAGNTPPASCANPQPTDPPDGGQLIVSAGASVPMTLTGPVGAPIVTTASVLVTNQHIEPRHQEVTIFAYVCTFPIVYGSNTNVPGGNCFGPGAFPFAVGVDGDLQISGLTSNVTTGPVAVAPGLWSNWTLPNNATVTLNAATSFNGCFRQANDGVFVSCGGVASGEVQVKYIWEGEPVPEPLTVALTGSALIMLGIMGRRRFTKK